jgi:hypothetical protein
MTEAKYIHLVTPDWRLHREPRGSAVGHKSLSVVLRLTNNHVDKSHLDSASENDSF